MEPIKLSDHISARNGLKAMLEQYIGEHGYMDSVLVPVEHACLIMAIAKLAEDTKDWFPFGKWATIQAIEDRINVSIKNGIGRKQQE